MSGPEEGNDDGSGVLERGAGGWLFLLRRAIGFHDRAAAIAWILGLYLLAALFSSGAFANCQGVFVTEDGSALITSYIDGICEAGASQYVCQSGSFTATEECYDETVAKQAFLDGLGITTSSRGIWGERRSTFGAPCLDGDSQHHCWGWIDIPETATLDDYCDEVATGVWECEEAGSPCDDADSDDFTVNETLTSNPGLCELGDSAGISYTQCAYSESANANCEANVDEYIEYTQLLPLQIAYQIDVAYTSVECGSPESPTGDFDLGPCDDPPPTCPVGQSAVYDDVTSTWSCVAPDAPDLPTPPTSTRESTTTTTSENPDGSVTTTSTSSTELGPCPEGEVCEDDAYASPELDDVKTLRESLEGFYDAVEGSPIASLGSGIGASVPETSSCPTWSTGSIPIVDETYTIDGHCQMMDGNEDLFRSVMAVVWAIIGVMIILSA